MELADVLASRRMVRSFSGRAPDPDVLDTLLARATAAPSAGNTGGWDAVVLEGAEQTRVFWAATTTEEWRARARRWPVLARAPVIAALFADPGAYVARYAEQDKVDAAPGLGAAAGAWPVPYWFVDAGFAAHTLLLGAVDAGLGACFLGNFRGEVELGEALGVPTGRRYVGAVLLGEPGGDDPPSSSLTRDRRPRHDMIHRGRW